MCISPSRTNAQEELAAAQATTEDSYLGHGVQIVVGHYNGRLPDERKKNLTYGGVSTPLLKSQSYLQNSSTPITMRPSRVKVKWAVV